MMKVSHFSLLATLILLLAPGINAATTTVDDLLLADKVRISTWVEPGEDIIARQQVNLQIEIATDKWFSGGTRIGSVEIDDAIVLQRERFAVNSSRNEDGKTWTVQEWSIAVYPQRDGLFIVPDIPVKVSIAGENLESISGQLVSPSLTFVARQPNQFLDGMSAETDWVATTRFVVKESYDKTFEDLQPGDAVVRSIRISADDLPAMMLPGIDADSIGGIGVYPKPPKLEDRVNRGSYLAERSQTITYVVEKPGLYLLPRKSFYWWNLSSRSFELIELDAQAFEVIATSNAEDLAEEPLSRLTGNSDLTALFMKLAIASLLVILTGVLIRGLSTIPAKSQSNRMLTESALRKQFERACRQENFEEAMGLFYQWLDNYGGKSFKGSVRERLKKMNRLELNTAFSDIMQTIYTPRENTPQKKTLQKNRGINLKSFAKQFIKELDVTDNPSGFSQFRIELKLN